MKRKLIVLVALIYSVSVANLAVAGDWWNTVKRHMPSGDVKNVIYKVDPLVRDVLSIDGVQESLFDSSSKTQHDVGKVTIYTTERCGFCKKARDHLQRDGILHQEFDVEKSDIGQRDFNELKGRGVPIILVGKERMDGYDKARLQAMLDRAKQEAEKQKAEQQTEQDSKKGAGKKTEELRENESNES